MARQQKPLTRGQREMRETEGMTESEMESYLLCQSNITAELAARYLGSISPQGIRIGVRNGTLPVGIFSGAHVVIFPERLIKWKHGELGVDAQTLTRELTAVFGEMTSKMAELASEHWQQAIARIT